MVQHAVSIRLLTFLLHLHKKLQFWLNILITAPPPVFVLLQHGTKVWNSSDGATKTLESEWNVAMHTSSKKKLALDSLHSLIHAQ